MVKNNGTLDGNASVDMQELIETVKQQLCAIIKAKVGKQNISCGDFVLPCQVKTFPNFTFIHWEQYAAQNVQIDIFDTENL